MFLYVKYSHFSRIILFIPVFWRIIEIKGYLKYTKRALKKTIQRDIKYIWFYIYNTTYPIENNILL